MVRANGLDGLEGILFDFDGTLRHSVPSSIETFHRFVEEEGLAFEASDRRRALRWLYAYWADSEDLKADRALTAEQPESAFWLRHAWRHLQVLGASSVQAEALAPILTDRMREAGEPENHVPEEVPVVLRRLRAAGYKLGILSNRTNPIDELLAELGLSDWMEVVVVAGQVGSWKPDAALFHHSTGMLGLAPEQVAYVGDNYYADVLGARSAHLAPILLDVEGIFPEANCPVVRSLAELPDLLTRRS